MPASKPPNAPDFDAKGFSQRLHERVLTPTAKPYPVFDPVDDAGKLIGFPRFMQWVRGLRDAIVANGIFLDDVKSDLDAHKAADNSRHTSLSNRVAALEAQQSDPFPGSG